VNGEMTLTSLHPSCTLEDVQENTGWQIRVSENLRTTEVPGDEELRIIREELDPKHLYI
jgi:glutaconate CoA-transferase subunit B